MRRLSVRLVLSHVLVAVVGGLATFLIVRMLAPAMFVEVLRRGNGGQGRGTGSGNGTGTGDRTGPGNGTGAGDGAGTGAGSGAGGGLGQGGGQGLRDSIDGLSGGTVGGRSAGSSAWAVQAETVNRQAEPQTTDIPQPTDIPHIDITGQDMGVIGGEPGPQLRLQFAEAVNQSLGIGTAVGVAVAAILGVIVALIIVRSIGRIGVATREIASGRYDVRVPRSGTRELDALAHDVNALADSLAQTESRRVRLLGEVAHELRTPLTVLDGTLEGMIDGIVPADRENLASLTEEVRRMRRLAEDLSLLSRAEEGRISVEPVPINLREIAEDAVQRLVPQAQDSEVSLGCAPGVPVPTTGDPDRLTQVLTNLIGNALRATPAGGSIKVEVASEPSPTVRVTDTGEGLAPEDLTRIFERFYRAPRRESAGVGAAGHDAGSVAGTGDAAHAGPTATASDSSASLGVHANADSGAPGGAAIPGAGSGAVAGAPSGSGIGLTIARQIMHAHGGELTAESAGLGAGATFTMILPLG